MRLFAAIDPPEELRHHLAGLVADVDGLRPTPVEQLHLTLAFLGEVNPRDIAPIEEALTEVALSPLELETARLGSSGQGVLWLEIVPSSPLMELQRQITNQINALGIVRLERRRYRPHITLARYRRGQHPALGSRVAEIARQRYHWRSKGFGLYASQLRPEGAVHSLLSEFVCEPPLRPRRPKPGS